MAALANRPRARDQWLRYMSVDRESEATREAEAKSNEEEIRAAESLGKDGGLNEVCMLDPFVGFRRGVSVFRQEPAPPHQGAL